MVVLCLAGYGLRQSQGLLLLLPLPRNTVAVRQAVARRGTRQYGNTVRWHGTEVSAEPVTTVSRQSYSMPSTAMYGQ